MRDTKLILIDGLPGSGKSTTSEYLLADYARHKISARLLGEHDPGHPLNVGGSIHPAGTTIGDAFFSHYTIASFQEESIERWSNFAAGAAEADTVYILDSYPYQNAVRLLFQMDAAIEDIEEYERRIEQIMAPLKPVLIYLDIPDAEALCRSTCHNRGPEWTEYFAAVATRCPYARRMGWHGLDGALQVLCAYKELLDANLQRLPYPVLVLEPNLEGWQRCYKRVDQFLGVTTL